MNEGVDEQAAIQLMISKRMRKEIFLRGIW
jgi:hypothetical protein